MDRIVIDLTGDGVEQDTVPVPPPPAPAPAPPPAPPRVPDPVVDALMRDIENQHAQVFAHQDILAVARRVLEGGPGAEQAADAVTRAIIARMNAGVDDALRAAIRNNDPAAEVVMDAVNRHAVLGMLGERVNDGDDDDDEEADGEEEYEDLEVRLDRMEGELRTARAEIERLTDRDELHRHEVEVLRNHVRRANADRVNTRAAEISRRDAAFFDGVRRRFVESWREDLELMMKMQPHQLLFFGHLLNLPVITSTDKLE